MATQTLPSAPSPQDTPVETSIREVEFDLEPEDLLAFINFHYVDAPAVRRQRFLLATLGVGILAALPVIVVLGSDKPSDQTFRSIWPLLLGPIAFLVCFPLFYRRSVKRTCWRLLDAGDRRGYYGPRTMSLEDHGIRERTIRGDTTRAWPSIRRIVQLKHHALIYTSATEAFIVPRQAFKDSDSFEDFLAHAAKRARLQLEST